jgi:hypothetical protein
MHETSYKIKMRACKSFGIITLSCLILYSPLWSHTIKNTCYFPITALEPCQVLRPAVKIIGSV